MRAARIEALRLEVQRLDRALREKVRELREAEDADWHETLAALERGRRAEAEKGKP